MKIEPTNAFNTLREHQVAFLDALLTEQVEFIVVGGYAMRCLGHMRNTEDLDIVIEQTEANVLRIQAACEHLPSCNRDSLLFLLQPEKKLIWYDVEVFSSMRGLSYSAMQADAEHCEWNGRNVNFVSNHWMQQAKMLAVRALDRQIKQKQTDEEDLAFLRLLPHPPYVRTK